MIAAYCNALGVEIQPFDWIYRAITPGATRRRVLYHASLRQLTGQQERPVGIALPLFLHGANAAYDLQTAIRHIRLWADDSIANVPIIVLVCGNAEFDQAAELLTKDSAIDYESIGVSIDRAELPASDWQWSEPRPVALKRFQETQANSPDSSGGRHDLANHWGAYSILLALTECGFGSSDYCSANLEHLLEDTYFKKKYRQFLANRCDFNVSLVDDLRTERNTLDETIARTSTAAPYRVLIVEDQLEDGWRAAYTSLFNTPTAEVSLTFAQDIEQAKNAFNAAVDLVILDVRLERDRLACPDELHQDESLSLSGVEIAQWIRQKQADAGGTVPILAATASNKVWTLEALLRFGINDYWVKASPDHCSTINDSMSNGIDLYQRLTRTVSWAAKTRSFIDAAYWIASVVSAPSSPAADEKAASLHALLHRAFDQFSRKKDQGLQTNLTYLLAFSFRNEIISWAFNIQSQSDGVRYFVKRHDQPDVDFLLVIPRTSGRLPFQLSDEAESRLDGKIRSFKKVSNTFPDTVALAFLLSVLNLNSHLDRYEELCELRNHLRQVHGIEFAGPSLGIRDASEKDVTDVLYIYGAIVAALTDRQLPERCFGSLDKP